MMSIIRFSKQLLSGLLGGGVVCLALSVLATAQVQTQKTEAHGPTAREVKIERGEIVYINGNNVVVKMEDGSFRHFDNVPESTTVMVDGKQINIHSVKVGMKVEKQTIMSTTPKVITTVETVTGKVWHITPPTTVILTLENGENQSFKIPNGQKFMVDGVEKDAWGLKKGMKIQAQRVTEVPETVVTQEVRRTGKMPPPPPEPKADIPILVATAPAAPAPVETAAAEPAPKKLPKTASDFPLIGVLGALLCAVSLTGMAIRKTTALFFSAKA